MALLDIDRNLLQLCLSRKPHAWESFVDRFLGLVLHVVRHAAKSRSVPLSAEDEEDLAAEFFLAVIRDDFALLRRFRGESSLATYLTVVARRIVVRELLKRFAASSHGSQPASEREADVLSRDVSPEARISNSEEVQRLMRGLTGPEADVVRMYHLEGKSYREISSAVGLPENSIGPTLSRARAKMRQAMANSSV